MRSRPRGAHAVTDVTGFGLAGHASEMAEGARLTIEIDVAAARHRRRRAAGHPPLLHRASKSNRAFLEGRLRIEPTADPSRLEFAFDAQTSGGLLIAVDPRNLGRLLEELQFRGAASSAVVGLVTERQGEAAVILREDVPAQEDRSLRVAMIGRGRFVVLLEQVVAEIALEIAPDAVDVVGVVLGVVVFDQEGRALDAVVVGLAAFQAARPGEADLVDARLEDLAQVVGGQLGAESFGIEDDDRVQQLFCAASSSGRRMPAGSSGLALRRASERMSLGASAWTTAFLR